jgi:hypothetical protein
MAEWSFARLARLPARQKCKLKSTTQQRTVLRAPPAPQPLLRKRQDMAHLPRSMITRHYQFIRDVQIEFVPVSGLPLERDCSGGHRLAFRASADPYGLGRCAKPN